MRRFGGARAKVWGCPCEGLGVNAKESDLLAIASHDRMSRMKRKNGELVCVMANQIAEARHRLTVQEQRMILWLIAQIEPKDKDFLTHTLAVKDFEHIAGVSTGRLYEYVKFVATGLLQRILEIREPGARGWTRFQWFSQVKYHDGEGTFTVRFHELLRPYLLELKSRFTQLDLGQAMKLRGGHSIRFYELLKAREGMKRFEMTVQELREWAGFQEGEMTRTNDLTRFVVEMSKRELDLKADLSFDYDVPRRGHRIHSYAFRVRKNKPAKRPRKPAMASKASEADDHAHKAVAAGLRDFRSKLAAPKAS